MIVPNDPGTRDHAADRILRSIADTSVAARFQCWIGASGRRYTVSVFACDAHAPDRGLPDFDGCVVIPVCREAGVGAFRVEDFRDARRVRTVGMAAGATEWHVHLLAEDAASREAAVDDLRRRLG